jgi:hypothetical protein
MKAPIDGHWCDWNQIYPEVESAAQEHCDIINGGSRYLYIPHVMDGLSDVKAEQFVEPLRTNAIQRLLKTRKKRPAAPKGRVAAKK